MISQEAEQAIVALFNGTRTVKEIVRQSGYSRKTVHKIAMRHGLNHYGRDRQYENQQEAYKLRCQGLSWDGVADVLGYASGVSAAASARAYMKREGIKEDESL